MRSRYYLHPLISGDSERLGLEEVFESEKVKTSLADPDPSDHMFRASWIRIR